MKKRSLIFGIAMFVCLALIFSGCENPADGSSGGSGANGPGTFTNGDVDAAALEAVYELTDTVVVTNGVTSISGKIPAGKTLIVAGAIPVGPAATDTLEVEGTLEIKARAELDASGLSSAGLLTGTGSVIGDGTVALPFVKKSDLAAYEAVSSGGLTYLSGNVTATGKYAGSYSGAAVTVANIPTIFGLTGDDAIAALTVKDITALTNTAVPAGKTLTLIGAGNTFAALDLSGKGTLVVAKGAELAATGLLTVGDGTTTTGTVQNNGNITTSETTAANVLSYITKPTGSGTVEIGGTVDLGGTASLTLTQNVEIADSITLTAPALAAAGPAFSGGKTITIKGILVLPANVTSVGASVENEGVIATKTTSVAVLNTLFAHKGTIASTADVTSSGAITVPADTILAIASGTFSVAANATLTVAADAGLAVANGATLSVAGTVDATAGTLAEVGGTITATGSGQIKGVRTYPLVAADGTDPVKGTPSLLAATAVQTADSSGKPVITITVTNKTGQTFTGTADFGGSNNLWGAKRSSAPAWTWGDIAVGALFADLNPSATVLSVYSTNDAYVYYKGSTNDIATSPLTTKPAKGNEANIYIPESGLPYKWKAYAANTFNSTTTWGIILAKEATTKVITLKILTHSDYNSLDAGTHVKTLVIDYSGVTIAEPPPSP